MDPIVECVPNISEGRDRRVIDAVADAVRSVDGVRLLDVDPGRATNRTVYTFVGPPEAVKEAAFRLVRTTQSLVDMRTHQGEHPRQGATDVCPLVPVRDCTLADCAAWARQLGRRIGDELGIPVYLYGEAASSEPRRLLANVRAGEYEGLPSKLAAGRMPPDFGPSTWNETVARAGATQVGARAFLVAYNVTLNTRDRKKANDIAFAIRESGRAKRTSYPDGEIVRHPDGTAVKIPGRLKGVAAVGWYIEEYGAAQVSVNITDHHVTPVHTVFDTVEEEAAKRGLRVTGSELVGLVPLDAMLAAGRHYLRKAGKTAGVSEAELVHTAVRSLGLADVRPFDASKSIIEYAIRDRSRSLVEKTCRGFADELASDSPAPGGGSVAALSGALGCALVAMVGALTHGRAGQEDDWSAMEELGVRAQAAKDWFLDAVDRDTDAFNRLMDALRIKARTPAETAAKDAAVAAATRGAIDVPLQVLERCRESLALVEAALGRGNPNALSDVGVAAALLQAGAEGAAMNVLINLGGVKEAAWAKETAGRVDAITGDLRRAADAVVEKVRRQLAGAAAAPADC
ncbi:MAG: glutamate formimidoyltransferase [Planctomycetes bacterium]|nr:glutamate formimidoyltransferase [Planctomycetota bacterium]